MLFRGTTEQGDVFVLPFPLETGWAWAQATTHFWEAMKAGESGTVSVCLGPPAGSQRTTDSQIQETQPRGKGLHKHRQKGSENRKVSEET